MKYITLIIGLLVVGCGKQEQADTNESTPTTTEKPVKELTLREKVVGTYELKRYGGWEKLVLLNTGVFEMYHDGKVEEYTDPSLIPSAETPSPSIPTTQETNEAQPKTDSKSKEETKNPDANPIVEKAVLEVEGKWKITNGEIHVDLGFGGVEVFRINEDKSITWFGHIRDGKRTERPKRYQYTYKKIK
jgi:hypothetical protein